MKRSGKIMIIFCLILIPVFAAGCTEKQPEIAVLNMEKLLNESKRAQELRTQLEKVSESLEKNYEQKEKESDTENEDKELDNIYMEFLNNKQELEGKLNEEINNILVEMSENENYDIVLYKKYVKYGGQDITDGVIEELDTKYFKGGKAENGNGE